MQSPDTVRMAPYGSTVITDLEKLHPKRVFNLASGPYLSHLTNAFSLENYATKILTTQSLSKNNYLFDILNTNIISLFDNQDAIVKLRSYLFSISPGIVAEKIDKNVRESSSIN